MAENLSIDEGAKNLTIDERAKMEEFVKLSFDFARADDSESLKIMLDNGLNPNLANHKGDTLLMLASYHNALNCVKLLLECGANVDKPNDRGHTPLGGVCFKGYGEVARMLLEAGANPNSGGALSPINTAIMFRRKEILSLLLQHNKQKIPLWKRVCARILRF